MAFDLKKSFRVWKLKTYPGRFRKAFVKDLSLPEVEEESPDSVGRHTI